MAEESTDFIPVCNRRVTSMGVDNSLSNCLTAFGLIVKSSIGRYFKVLNRSSEYLQFIVSRMVEIISKERTHFPFLLWKSLSVRSKKIRSGLKILEKQKKRKAAENRKKNNINPDFEIIKQEKGLSSIIKLVNRANYKLKFFAFEELVKNKIQAEKIKFYLKLKHDKKEKNIFSEWRHLVHVVKLKRKIFFAVLRRISERRIKECLVIIFRDLGEVKKIKSMLTHRLLLDLVKMRMGNVKNAIIDRRGEVSVIYYRLATEKIRNFIWKRINSAFWIIFACNNAERLLKRTLAVEKLKILQSKMMKNYFAKIILRSLDPISIKCKLIVKELRNLFHSKLCFSFSMLSANSMSIRAKRFIQAFKKLNEVLLKHESGWITSLKPKTYELNILKISLAINKLTRVSLRPQFFCFNLLKLSSSKYNQISASLLSFKLSRLILNTKKFTFQCLKWQKTLQNVLKFAKSLGRLIRIKKRSFTRHSMLALKYYINTRRNRELLWHLRFFQLESLATRNKQRVILKLQTSYFSAWKAFVNRISLLKQKAYKTTAEKFVNTLSPKISALNFFAISEVFFSIKSFYVLEKNALNKINKIFTKQKMYVAFLRFISKRNSSPSKQKSKFSLSSSIELSPRASMTQKINSQIPKRYGFHSNKRLSLDINFRSFSKNNTPLEKYIISPSLIPNPYNRP